MTDEAKLPLRAALAVSAALLLIPGGSRAGGGAPSWPEARDVPGGTLAWTVEYKGSGVTETSEMKEVAHLHRKLHGTAHLTGAMGNAGDTPHSAPLESINQAMEACGDDMACQRKAAMQAMAMVQKDPDAFERSVGNAMNEAQRDTIWAADDCDLSGEVDDTSTWSGMTPGGYNTGVGTRTGKPAIEGCGDGQAPRLLADDNTHTYSLELPSALVRVKGELDGRADPVPRRVEFPELHIDGIRYASLERPLKGKVTLHQGKGRGLWSEGWDMPLTEEVSWTFTPD